MVCVVTLEGPRARRGKMSDERVVLAYRAFGYAELALFMLFKAATGSFPDRSLS